MSGVLARFPWLLPVRNSFASYGASAVTRTSDRGHVAEASNQVHRSGGVSIRVSEETFLPLNVPGFQFLSSMKMPHAEDRSPEVPPAAGGKRKMVFRGLPRACWDFFLNEYRTTWC